MSRVTAAFVCALCDPDNPRPASIMCSNNCGRYVCSVHATPRKGPGSAMVCASCAEALGIIDKPKPKPVPEVRPLIEIPTEPAPAPQPVVETKPSVETKPTLTAEAAAFKVEPFVVPEPFAEPSPVAQASEDVTLITPVVASPPKQEPVIIDNAVPAATAARLVTDPEPAPKSAASETVVSQRGNTLQVPKVAPTLGKPPQPIAPKPRKAQRAGEGVGSSLDWKLIGTSAATVVLGILGLLLIIVAIRGG
jgi:hypothetical protein